MVMDKNRQIEEMARDICEYYNSEGTCSQDNTRCDLRCTYYYDAKYIYDKGYRKASDVAREIFEEIEKLQYTKYDWTDVVEWDAIAELKKKYTEGEG